MRGILIGVLLIVGCEGSATMIADSGTAGDSGGSDGIGSDAVEPADGGTGEDSGSGMDAGPRPDAGPMVDGGRDAGRVLMGSRPYIDNFRTDNENRNRVYFDAHGDIDGLTQRAFVVSGKTIVGLNSAENYFTVGSDFTYWDNNTIRLGEIDGSATGDGTIHDFELQYIQNQIAEPTSSGSTYYVDGQVGSSGDGGREASAFKTIQEGIDALRSPGDVLYVKAGDYGAETLVIDGKRGSAENPIRVLGYTRTPGDTPSAEFGYPSNLDVDPATMPTLTDNPGTAITVRRCQYFMFKNFQKRNGSGHGIYITGGTSDSVFQNLIFRGADDRSSGVGVNSNNVGATRLRLLNTRLLNHGRSKSVSFPGSFNLVDGLNVIVTSVGGNYALYTTRSNSIFRHVRIEDYTPLAQHGISVKGDDAATEHNLIEHSYVEGMTAALESRHHEVRFNVYRDIEVRDNDRGGNNGVSAINLWGGSYNVYDRITAPLTRRAVYLLVNQSDNGNEYAPVGNVIKNSNFYRDLALTDLGTRTVALYYHTELSTPSAVIRDNKIINSNFVGLSDFQEVVGPATEMGNEVINCNIIGLYGDNEGDTTRYVNTNFYDNAFSAPSGDGILNVDPRLADPENGDFSFSEATPASIYNGGADTALSRYGFDGNERLSGMFAIGAYERD